MNATKSQPFLITNRMRPKHSTSSSTSSTKPPLFKKTNSLLTKSTQQQPFFNSIHNKAPQNGTGSNKVLRPSTTASGVRGGFASSKLRRPGKVTGIHRPDTAPSGARPVRNGNKNDVDDKTQISVLKSDIVLLHQKMTKHQAKTEQSGTELETTLNNYQYKAGCKTQNVDTKMQLVDILFDKMGDLQKGLLDETAEHVNVSITSRIKAKQAHDSNLSKLSNYFNFVDHVMHMHAELKKSKKGPSTPLQCPSIHKPSVVTMLAPSSAKTSNVHIKRKSPSKYKDELRKLKKESAAETKKLRAKLKTSEQQRLQESAVVASLKKEMSDLNTTHAVKVSELEKELSSLKAVKPIIKQVTKVDTMAVDALKKELNAVQKHADSQMDTIKKKLLESQQAYTRLKKEDQHTSDTLKETLLKLKTSEEALTTLKKGQASTQDEKKKLVKLEYKLMETTQQLADAEAKLKHLSNAQPDKATFEKEMEALRNTMAQLKKENARLTTLASTHERDIQRLKDIEIQYKCMKPEMERLVNMQSNEEEESLNRLAKMQAYLERVEKAYAALQKEASGLRDRVASLEQSENLYQDAMAELRVEREKRIEFEKQAQMVSRVKRLNEKVMKAESLLRDRDIALAASEQSLRDEQTVSSKLKRDVRRLLDDIENKDSQIKRLEEIQKQVARDALANSLTTQRSNNDALIDEVRALREAFQAKLRAAQAQVEQLKHKHASQLLTIQTAVQKERELHAAKLKSLQQRCDILTQRVKEAIS